MEVDLGILARNYRAVRRRVGPDIRIIAALKANAYGHGVVPVAETLVSEGVDVLATGSFADAVAMRRAGIDTRILLFGSHFAEDTRAVLRARLTPTVYNLETAQAVSDVARDPTPVYVKVDSGLGRLGVPLSDAEAFIKRVVQLPNVAVEGVYTHLPFKDATGRKWAEASHQAFVAMVDSLAAAGVTIPVIQARSSAGVLGGIEDGPCNAISPGHALYGLPPASADVTDLSGLDPVLSAIKSRLVQVTRHPTPRTVGRAGGISLPAGAVTGVLPFGMVHGYRDGKATQPVMLLHGHRVPVLAISLEYVTLDLTDVSDAQVGDEVVVLGCDGANVISLADIASWQGATILDVLMTLNTHLECRFVKSLADGNGHVSTAGPSDNEGDD
jgi:alanine racemase